MKKDISREEFNELVRGFEQKVLKQKDLPALDNMRKPEILSAVFLHALLTNTYLITAAHKKSQKEMREQIKNLCEHACYAAEVLMERVK